MSPIDTNRSDITYLETRFNIKLDGNYIYCETSKEIEILIDYLNSLLVVKKLIES
jgi:hypothetical protein